MCWLDIKPRINWRLYRRKLIWLWLLTIVILWILLYSTRGTQKRKNINPFFNKKWDFETLRYDNTTSEIFSTVKEITKCSNKERKFKIGQRGDYWVLYNIIQAQLNFGCQESITYCTHGDYTFLYNLNPLLKRWQGPVSIAVYAPGYDFKDALLTILHIRNCQGDLIKKFVTFHLFFHKNHLPAQSNWDYVNVLQSTTNTSGSDCSFPKRHKFPYKTTKNLTYPVNVARNVAKESAETHYVLVSDIELYPSFYLIPQFLAMIARNSDLLQSSNPKVFPLNLFEVEEDQGIPENKTRLREMLENRTASPFHKYVCPKCHITPSANYWEMAEESQNLDIFTVGKRAGPFKMWEPIYIGTQNDPFYDERLSWEGKGDKMSQAYIMCLLDYDFMILNNAFLVHRPGIKSAKINAYRQKLMDIQDIFIRSTVLSEINIFYGSRPECL